MTPYIKVAVIGGTGKAGKYIVKNLLAQGFSIKTLLRYPEKFQISSPLIEIVKGDARDLLAIRQLLKDCQAIISAVGQPVGEPSVFSQVTRNIIQVMHEYQMHRYILITGLNVDTPFDQKSPKTKFGTDWMKTNYPLTTADKQVEYETLVESDIDWTLVRLPMIEQTDTINEIKIDLEDCPGDQISATDLALFLIKQLTDQKYIKKAPFISSVKM
ncbi:NAD(P)-dependent oxidoreductase [Pedobacter sp. UC225_65]|uniref:NAD(P)-dependent oxidoreductase n=1 Tax=Pedobacter sp. UC225_65 TaxID=3350173 RepID=UPI003672C170